VENSGETGRRHQRALVPWSLMMMMMMMVKSDIVHDIQDRRKRFMYNMYNSHNEVVSHLAV